MVSFVTSSIIFLLVANFILLTKAINVGLLIEERFDIAANSSVFPEFCLSKLAERFGIQLIVRKYLANQPEDVHYHVHFNCTSTIVHNHFRHSPVEVQLKCTETKLHLCMNELVSRDCLVVITYASCEMQDLIQVYLTSYGRLHVPLPDTYCFRASGGTRSPPVRMRPKTNLLMEAIVSVISYLHWPETNIITDGSFDYHQEISLMSSLSRKGVRFTLHRLNYTKATFASEMQRYKPRIATNFFLVLMDREGTIKTLQAASQLNLIQYNTQWIIGNLDVNNADLQRMNLDPNQMNIAAFKLPCTPALKRVANHHRSAISIMEFRILQIVLRFLNRCLSAFKSDDQFPEKRHNYTQMSLHSTVSSPNQDGVTQSLFSVMLGNDTVDHYEIVRVESRQKRQFEFLQIGEWRANNKGITQTSEPFFPNSQTGFGNRVLKVAFNQITPYISKKKGSNPPEFVGFNVDILEQLSLKLNFRYILIETPDQLFGTLNKSSGEWNGVIGMTARNEVDLGVDPLTLTYERFSAVDYTQPYMEDGMGILMKRPDGKQSDLLQSYRVFAESTWFAFAVSFILSFMILTIVNKGSAYIRGKNKVPKPTRSYKYNFWLMFGYSLQEGSGIEPVNTPGRIIVGFWWLFIILVSTNYTANLAAFLTVPIDSFPIRNLHDLAKYDFLTPITIYGTDKFQFFQTSNDELYKSIGEKIESGPHYKYYEPIITLVDSHDYAFVSDESFTIYLANKRCGFYLVITEPACKQSLGFVLPKGSPYKDMISNSIVSMQEAGLIEKLKKRWWNNSAECTAPSEVKHMEANGLKMDAIGGAFIIYTCIAILGIICVIIEMIVARINGRQKQNPQPTSAGDT